MGSINAIDNYDRIMRDFLEPGTRRLLGGESLQGEHVQVAAIDGRFRVLDARADGSRDDGVRWRRATLMLTERHAIAYQARGGFRRDYGIAVPYRSLAVVSYRLLAARHGKMATIGIRFEPRNGGDPMLEFATDVDDAFAYDATIKTIITACSVGGVTAQDESDSATMDALGLHPISGNRDGHGTMARQYASDGMAASGAFHDGTAMDGTARGVYYPRSYAMPSGTEPKQKRQTSSQRQAQGSRGDSVQGYANGMPSSQRARQQSARSDTRNAGMSGTRQAVTTRRASGANEARRAYAEPLRDDMSVAKHHDSIVAASNKNSGGNRLRRSHRASSGGNQNGTYR